MSVATKAITIALNSLIASAKRELIVVIGEMVSFIRSMKMVESVLVISKSVSFWFKSELYIFLFFKTKREDCEECYMRLWA